MVYETDNGELPFIGASAEEKDIQDQGQEQEKDNRTKAEETTDPFWLKDYSIIWQQDRLTEFIPMDSLSYAEKLNAILRFSIYSAIAIIIYRQQPIILLFPIFVAGLTLYIYKYNYRQNIGLNSREKKCTESTITNPFMNVLISDYMENPNRPPACDESDGKIDNNFRRNLYRNSFDDVYGKEQSRRQFYTMPVTDIEQSGYSNYINWLYNTGPNCKIDNSKCDSYTDVRFKRRPVEYTQE